MNSQSVQYKQGTFDISKLFLNRAFPLKGYETTLVQDLERAVENQTESFKIQQPSEVARNHLKTDRNHVKSPEIRRNSF